jgi:hypothetical protein
MKPEIENAIQNDMSSEACAGKRMKPSPDTLE